MNRWWAKRTLRLWVALAITLLMIGATIWATMQLLADISGTASAWRIDLTTFAWFATAVSGFLISLIMLYRVGSALTLHYRVDRNALTIHWLGNTAVVPMNLITAVEPSVDVKQKPGLLTRFGYISGVGQAADEQILNFFSTQPAEQSLLLRTTGGSYVITPAQRDSFIQEVESRLNLGVVQVQSEGVVRSTRIAYDFWLNNAVRWALVVGLLLNFAVWGLIAWRYNQLPLEVPIRIDATGAVSGVEAREQLLALPLVGLLAWLINAGFGALVYRTSRAGAFALLIGSSVIQLFLAVAVWVVVRG
ncbi:MAG TPA: hypothetical protein DEF47_06965 [Herpetosiphon sp.]|uniref:Bacterial Pleckstrin homology domain-containing protein n=1 Tax=Herpetosiphon aurantiacus (strain ATCC 23779 / DSM 785 / 114-95) TaxID=316274 RepID=A9B463_HERA2|nr:PH domain-containing protein [Herpetosiphon sp.]ABX07596.1 conserved hypothetical protein [Herpetosiphon aurantiacus DSM 785]HBW49628.1 hypothetical protein [Herpetosiphon sp.]